MKIVSMVAGVLLVLVAFLWLIGPAEAKRDDDGKGGYDQCTYEEELEDVYRLCVGPQ